MSVWIIGGVPGCLSLLPPAPHLALSHRLEGGDGAAGIPHAILGAGASGVSLSG